MPPAVAGSRDVSTQNMAAPEARTPKGLKHRAKLRHQIARVRERVANRRQDFLHKLDTDLLRRFDAIYIEDLNVAGLVRHPVQSEWAEFRRQLGSPLRGRTAQPQAAVAP